MCLSFYQHIFMLFIIFRMCLHHSATPNSTNAATNTTSRHRRVKRSIYGLDSHGPYLPPPFGPVPFAPFGLASPFAQPPFALPYHNPYGPPPYAVPNSYPLPPWLPPPPPHPYQNPIFAPPPRPLFLPPTYFSAPPVVAPAAPVGPAPAPIIVPAKTAAALSIASIIHAFIARKFYPPVLPVPITKPVPVPVPVPVEVPLAERGSPAAKNLERNVPHHVTILKPIQYEPSAAVNDFSLKKCAQNLPNLLYENTFTKTAATTTTTKTSTETPRRPTIIPLRE